MSFIPQKLFVAVFESDPKFRHAWGHVRQGQNLAMSGGPFMVLANLQEIFTE